MRVRPWCLPLRCAGLDVHQIEIREGSKEPHTEGRYRADYMCRPFHMVGRSLPPAEGGEIARGHGGPSSFE